MLSYNYTFLKKCKPTLQCEYNILLNYEIKFPAIQILISFHLISF